MAKVIDACLIVRFSQLVRDDDETSTVDITEKDVKTLDAALGEVMDLPPGIIVEIEFG